MRTLSILLLLTACSEYGLGLDPDAVPDPRPDIDVQPGRLDLGSVDLTVGSAEGTLQIRNTGLGRLTVDSLTILDESPFSLVEDPAPFQLGEAETREIRVRFDASAPGSSEGVLRILSDDPDESGVDVPLSARARGPWLTVEPATHDFGTSPVPCEKEVDVILQNLGDAPLTVDAVDWEHDPDLHLQLEREPPFELGPASYVVATVRLRPTAEGDVSGALTVRSTDPRGPQVATQTAERRGAGSRRDAIAIPADPPVDLIIAVDRSASMEDDAERLADSFGEFVATLGAVTDNWHLGVVTLDGGCFNEGTLTTRTPDYEGAFARAVTTGEDRDIADDEALFSLVDRAIANTAPGRCNAGFRRPDAALHIIAITDEPERSTDRASSLTWDHFVARWRAEVAAPTLLKISGVVDLGGCGDGADGYAQAIAETDGIALSICSSDWSDTASSLARATLTRTLTVELSEDPVPSTIRVAVDGETLEDGWVYDAAANAVIVDAQPVGAELEARYIVAGNCP